jgi:hypothetical protein
MSKRIVARTMLVLFLGCMVFAVGVVQAVDNDNFDNATVITAAPFSEWVDMYDASIEVDEPLPPCASYETNKTIWYTYTPTNDSLLVARSDYGYEVFVAAYTGDLLNNLDLVGCTQYYESLVIQATAGTTYYFQLGNRYEWTSSAQFSLLVDPPLNVYIDYYSDSPSIYTTIYFYGYVDDPANVGVESWLWNFGDGTTAATQSTNHRFAEDGVYTVTLTATSYDGRSATATRTVIVETHDVALVRFSTPRAAQSGQTKQISVGVSNLTNYTDQVTVSLYKATAGPYNNEEFLGSLRQTVFPNQAGQTTTYSFNYTFTEEDAAIGKVTFIVRANIEGKQDAIPGDNELISKLVKISK